jgi:hypothetical protein
MSWKENGYRRKNCYQFEQKDKIKEAELINYWTVGLHLYIFRVNGVKKIKT